MRRSDHHDVTESPPGMPLVPCAHLSVRRWHDGLRARVNGHCERHAHHGEHVNGQHSAIRRGTNTQRALHSQAENDHVSSTSIGKYAKAAGPLQGTRARDDGGARAIKRGHIVPLLAAAVP